MLPYHPRDQWLKLWKSGGLPAGNVEPGQRGEELPLWQWKWAAHVAAANEELRSVGGHVL